MGKMISKKERHRRMKQDERRKKKQKELEDKPIKTGKKVWDHKD